MNVIIPMAGRGTRLRPHTLTVPKPLIPIAGKPIVQRLVEEIATVVESKIDQIAFIIGDFGKKTEEKLKQIGKDLNCQVSIFVQDKPLGTAHAIYCAKSIMTGPCVIAFADTLFKANFNLNKNKDGVIWVKKVDDPSSFGVVKIDENENITEFIEKPRTFVSDLAIIGVYYIKKADDLLLEIEHLLSDNIKSKGEYQLTDALEIMKSKGKVFTSAQVKDWMDCGNKKATLETNFKILEYEKNNQCLTNQTAQIINSQIIHPCYIGPNVEIKNSIIGPYVSIGNHTKIENCSINRSLIQNNAEIYNANLTDSMIGNFVIYKGVRRSISLGDYSSLNF